MNFLSKIISLTLTSQKESTMQLLSLSSLIFFISFNFPKGIDNATINNYKQL